MENLNLRVKILIRKVIIVTEAVIIMIIIIMNINIIILTIIMMMMIKITEMATIKNFLLKIIMIKVWLKLNSIHSSFAKLAVYNYE